MTDTRIQVTRTIDAPTNVIFDLLTLPARHHEFDGSGMLRSADNTERIQQVGDTFTMNMHTESMGGDYRMRNLVTAYAPNKLVGWQPSLERHKGEPDGWEWVYSLEAVDAGTTEVTLTYDWSKVTNEKILPMFPAVSATQLEESLNQLAAAVATAS